MDVVAAVVYLAAAGADQVDGGAVSQLLGYGVPGLVIVLIITRVLVPGWVVSRQDQAHQAEIAAKDQTIATQSDEIGELRAALDGSVVFVRDKIVPALTLSMEISRAYTDALNRRADHR